MTWQRIPRARWHGTMRIALLGLYCAMPWMVRSTLSGSLDKFISAGAFCLALLLELIVKPRLDLPASRVCPRCDTCNSPKAKACVRCGREWVSDEVVLYAPYLKDIPAARVAHRRAIAVLIVLGAATLIPMFLYPTQIGMAAYFVVIYYGYELVTGAMLKRTHRTLFEHAGGLCTHCTYPLVESSPQCPECGVVGSVNDARRSWAASGMWHPDEATARIIFASPNEPQA